MEFIKQIGFGFCFGSGFILAAEFFRVALHMGILK